MNPMQKQLPLILVFVVFLSACAAVTKQEPVTRSIANNPSEPVIVSELPITDSTALSLVEQPRFEDGSFALTPGFYEAEFKSYCLEPGTPDPSRNDAYFLSAAGGGRKEYVETILRNSYDAPNIDQKHIQLLLWAVVSKKEFSKLPGDVQSTGRQLLNSKQIFELNGGMMGMVKTVATMIPSSGGNDIRKLFDLGTQSYEAYERIAVLREPSKISRPQFKLTQWYQHPDGYYLRYYPESYKKTRIQVYVPENAQPVPDSSANFIVFDPASMVIAPANSNAQKLGIGAPVIEVVKSVIKIIGNDKRPPRQKEPTGRQKPIAGT